ncbi:MAG TPA: TatD family hydrolase, partial [Candidatus Paceibacterota bacterium]|nr:TatD family hydrolase [Candidatus Paceibacterota bacterium]
RVEDEEVKTKQKELFKKHIELALEVDKPLMIHCRATQNNTQKNVGSPLVTDAHEDVLEILKDYRHKVGDKLRFNMHFFTGTWEMAKKFIELEGYFSFNGVITFTSQYDEVAKNIPLDRIMSETDAPFVAPEPFRGKRNEPAYVEYVAKRITELRSEPEEEVLSALVANANVFFDFSRKS